MFNKTNEEKKHIFEIKKLKIEKGYKTINWTQLIIVVIIFIVLTAGTFAILATWFSNTLMMAIVEGVEGFSKPFAQVFEANPEIMFALNEDLPVEALYLTLAKQMSAEANVDFNGYFTTRTERSLEKVNLSCINKYQIEPHSYENNPLRKFEFEVRVNNAGCQIIWTNKTGGIIDAIIKCPLKNCEQKEIQRIVMDEFIPKNINIERVKIEGD